MIYKFNDISERDIDMLLLEEISSEPDFLNLFLKKINIENAEVLEIEHSKTDVEWGESDLTIILQMREKKHALLIEDKIDAIAMSQQYLRYVMRGDKGIESGEYDTYDIFIVAPEKYLENNTEAKEYPNQVKYEEFAEYFAKKNDSHSIFKNAMFENAIHKQKHGYQVNENKAVTTFWEKYIKYQQEYYFGLQLISKSGPKGPKACWPRYSTSNKKVYIYHKSERGCIDLTFEGGADKLIQIESILREIIDISSDSKLAVVSTGKSAVLRKNVPKINFQGEFESQISNLRSCFQAISELKEYANIIISDGRIVKILAGMRVESLYCERRIFLMMKLKKLLGIIAIISLLFIIVNESIIAAICLLISSSISLGMLIAEKRKCESKK